MKLNKSHTFKSKYHNIKLVATEFVELHYGNTMWKYEFYINDKLIENEYLNNSSGGLYPNLDNFELESPDGEYVYIPNINNILYDIPQNKYYILNENFIAERSHFVKNIFTKRYLFIIKQEYILKVDLYSKKINKLPGLSTDILIDDAYIDNNKLVVEYEDQETYDDITKTFDF